MIGEIQVSMSEYGTFIACPGNPSTHIEGNDARDIAEALYEYIINHDERRRKNEILNRKPNA